MRSVSALTSIPAALKAAANLSAKVTSNVPHHLRNIVIPNRCKSTKESGGRTQCSRLNSRKHLGLKAWGRCDASVSMKAPNVSFLEVVQRRLMAQPGLIATYTAANAGDVGLAEPHGDFAQGDQAAGHFQTALTHLLTQRLSG